MSRLLARVRARPRLVCWLVVGALVVGAGLLLQTPLFRYQVLRPYLEQQALPGYVSDCRSDDPGVRARALETVFALRGTLTGKAVEQARDLVLEGLSDPDTSVRLTAAQAAGEIGLNEAAPPLRQLAANKDEDADVRCAAVAALGRLEDAESVGLLVGLLRGDDTTLHGAAEWALVGIGEPALRPAAALFAGSDAEVRSRGQSVLTRIGAPAIPLLLSYLGSSDPALAKSAAAALVQIGGPALSSLVGVLGAAETPRARVVAAQTLESIIDDRSMGPLLPQYGSRVSNALREAALHDPSADVRTAAVSSLATLGRLCDDDRAALACIEALHDRDPAVHDEARRALKAMGDPALRALNQKLAKYSREGGGKADPEDADALVAAYERLAGLAST